MDNTGKQVKHVFNKWPLGTVLGVKNGPLDPPVGQAPFSNFPKTPNTALGGHFSCFPQVQQNTDLLLPSAFFPLLRVHLAMALVVLLLRRQSGRVLLFSNPDALLVSPDAPKGSDLAFHVVWSRFRQLWRLLLLPAL